MVPAWVLDPVPRASCSTPTCGCSGSTLALALAAVTAVTVVLGYPVAYGLARTRSRDAGGRSV